MLAFKKNSGYDTLKRSHVAVGFYLIAFLYTLHLSRRVRAMFEKRKHLTEAFGSPLSENVCAMNSVLRVSIL